ncbi:hypothetical protein AUQ42_13560 [Thalassospira sp. MCCC 1A02491]|nr:hypothetical protein AUQ42_13560 [Thalassospira sp. MCCC 1A02491]
MRNYTKTLIQSMLEIEYFVKLRHGDLMSIPFMMRLGLTIYVALTEKVTKRSIIFLTPIGRGFQQKPMS